MFKFRSLKNDCVHSWFLLLTFITLFLLLTQQPGQRAHVGIVFSGADVAGGARTHGLHVILDRFRNWTESLRSPMLTPMARKTPCSGSGLGGFFVIGAPKRVQIAKPLESLERGERSQFVLTAMQLDVDHKNTFFFIPYLCSILAVYYLFDVFLTNSFKYRHFPHKASCLDLFTFFLLKHFYAIFSFGEEI